MRIGLLLLCWLPFVGVAVAEESDFSPLKPWTYPENWQNTLSVQGFWFPDEGLPEQSDYNFSLAYEGQYRQRIEGARAQFNVQPFLRLDQQDSNRSHADMRELSVTYLGRGWTLRGGIGQVTWGNSVLYSLVDVINQRDLIEADQQSKLGQPLLEYVQKNESSTLSLYVLPGFREATFPSKSGRPRTPIFIDSDESIVDDTQQAPFDYAIRWEKNIENFYLATSFFSGLSRVPRFEFNFDFKDPKIIPVYETVDQFGLELQWLVRRWAFSAEAISRKGDAPNYDQFKLGIEHQWNAMFGSGWDLFSTLEYIEESENEYSTSFLNNDYIAGLQLKFNDLYDTSLALAWIYDPYSKEEGVNFSFNRAINDKWDFNISLFVVKQTADIEGSLITREQIDQIIEDISQADLSSLQQLQRDLLALLGNNNYITSENEFVRRFVGDVLINQALSDLDLDDTIDIFNQLYVMGSTDQKLYLFRNDNFIRLEVNYRF